jgi:hypothetical protein
MILFVYLIVTLFVCPIHDDFFCIFICNDHLCIPSYDPLQPKSDVIYFY